METSTRRRIFCPMVAVVLLCAIGQPAAAAEDITAAGAEVDLGPLTFPVVGTWQVTHIVARVTVSFAEAADAAPHREPAGIVRLRDAMLGAVRDTRAREVADAIDVAAIERRLHRAIGRRAPGLEAVRFDVLGVRSDERP